MDNFSFIRTTPDRPDYKLFLELPKLLYPKNSPRFSLGHEPVPEHLEGCYVLKNNDQVVGRFAMYQNPSLQYNNQTAASFGSYECIEDKMTSQHLLAYAKQLAKKNGYEWLIGPMEGSTWNNYRFSNNNDYPNFFMEPFHHLYYSTQLKEAGLKPIAHYLSQKATVVSFKKNQLADLESFYLRKGAKFRSIDINNLEADLQKISVLSNESFQHNFLYSPIDASVFIQKYKSLDHLFDPQLVWLVEDKKGEVDAFIFAIKDYWDPSGKTVILKSLARRPSSTFRGIGRFLVNKLNQISFELGYENMIHAFMISDNTTVQMSKKFTSETYKTYSLYGAKL